ncbi:MAG: NUDIX domain-containing protein [Balneolales bacterium]
MPEKAFSNKVRVRVNGLLVENRKLLLVKFRHPTREGSIWMPPGGGVDFGEPMEDALQREFIEETGIEVNVDGLRYVHEFIEPPLHALEFYYDCRKTGGALRLGSDPELSKDNQLLEDVRFVPLAGLAELPVIPEHIQRHFEEEFSKGKCIPKVIRS